MENFIKAEIGQDETISKADGNLKRLSNEFYYDIVMLKDYRICGNGELLQIYVPYEYKSEWQKSINPELCKKPDLLCEMLTLRGNLSFELFEHLRFRNVNIKEQDLNTIIKWCKKNGFPFTADFKYRPDTKPLFDLQPSIFFIVWDFIYQLDEIYNAYLLYRRITEQKDELKNKYENTNVDQCKILFEDMYKKRVFTNQLSFKGSIHWEIKTENLFDAAFYQLALLLNEPKKEIRECPICHEYFERKHAKRKYCYNGTCYPQLAYKNKKKNG